MNFVLTEDGMKMWVAGEFQEGVIVDKMIFEVEDEERSMVRIYAVNNGRKIAIYEYEMEGDVRKVEIMVDINGKMKLTLGEWN